VTITQLSLDSKGQSERRKQRWDSSCVAWANPPLCCFSVRQNISAWCADATLEFGSRRSGESRIASFDHCSRRNKSRWLLLTFHPRCTWAITAHRRSISRRSCRRTSASSTSDSIVRIAVSTEQVCTWRHVATSQWVTRAALSIPVSCSSTCCRDKSSGRANMRIISAFRFNLDSTHINHRAVRSGSSLTRTSCCRGTSSQVRMHMPNSDRRRRVEANGSRDTSLAPSAFAASCAHWADITLVNTHGISTLTISRSCACASALRDRIDRKLQN
jgi:hypothetical protein